MGDMPKSEDLTLMSIDELWDVYQKVEAILAKKIGAELNELTKRLAQLNAEVHRGPRIDGKPKRHSKRRPYPKVLPKYQNPAQPSETWSGRGKPPRWLAAQLNSGRKIDNFRIE